MKTFIFLFSLFPFTQALSFDHTHQQFDKILKKVVHYQKSQGLVNYQTLKANPQKLEAYLKSLSSISKKKYQSFNRNQKIAFLINAYNAFTFKLIIDHHPVKSIKKIGSFLSSPWKKKFFLFLGEQRSLGFIEHDVLRKDFDEPRIHYGIVCASIGCPSIQKFAYTAKKLESQLAKSESLFLKDRSKNHYDKKENTLEVSKIFKWFRKDFKGQHGSVKAYLMKKMEVQGSPDIDYLSYDWKLNEWK